jgi:hypothetical protein
MDITKCKTVKQFEESIHSDMAITNKLREGWVLLAVQVKREVSSKGEFHDQLTYTLGHEDEK